MIARIEPSVDGREIVTVTWERQGIDAQTPVIKATFEIKYPQNAIYSQYRLILPVAAVRDDTFEAVDIIDEEYDEIIEAIGEAIGSHDPNW